MAVNGTYYNLMRVMALSEVRMDINHRKAAVNHSCGLH